MALRRQFEIAFVGLKPGLHEFQFDLGNEFFLEKGLSDNPVKQAQVKLTLDKSSGFMMLKFEVGGAVNVPCDRCGNAIDLALWDEFKVLVKLVEDHDTMNEQEEDPDVFYISRNESHLHVEDWIYEFVMLSIPMQRMCTPEEMGGPKCNKEVLERLKNMESQKKEEDINNLWKGLDKFKNN
jgi:uncharacterized metal-binding protein YceD (DUF177 family)